MTKEIFDRELSGFPDYLMPELIEKAHEIMRSHGIFAESKSEDLPVCNEPEVGFGTNNDKIALERQFNEVNEKLKGIAPWLVDFRNRFKDLYTDPEEVRLMEKDVDIICGLR